MIGPGGRVHAAPDGALEQPVPGRMELDLVDPVPEPVVGPELRRVAVGLEPPLDRFRTACDPADIEEEGGRPSGALAFDRLPQHRIRPVDVVVLERWWLVEDAVARSHHVPSMCVYSGCGVPR